LPSFHQKAKKKLNEKPLGIFEKLYGTEDSGVFAENLEAATRLYYGTAARAFLEHFTANWDETIRECTEFTDKFVQAELKKLPTVAPEIRRILRRCAIAGAAGEKATEIGITGWPPGWSRDSASFAFKRILERRGGVEGADARNAFEQVQAFMATQRSRLRSAEPLTDQNGNCVIERIPNSAGYWKTIDGQLVYLIDPKVFRDEVCRGYNYQAVAKDLRARGLLLLNQSRGFQRNETVALEGGVTERPPFIPVKATIIGASGDAENTSTASTGIQDE
jgi:hypothetical protein